MGDDSHGFPIERYELDLAGQLFALWMFWMMPTPFPGFFPKVVTLVRTHGALSILAFGFRYPGNPAVQSLHS
jgi:hypothetical protein